MNTGRFLAEWALAAGSDEAQIEVTSNVLEYSGDGRKWWGELCASRMKGEFGKRAVDSGLATSEDMESLHSSSWSEDSMESTEGDENDWIPQSEDYIISHGFSHFIRPQRNWQETESQGGSDLASESLDPEDDDRYRHVRVHITIYYLCP